MQHRIHVIFKGNVQGVGFRYTARGIAQRHSLTGYVKNITSGNVEVVAEGDHAQLVQFIEEVEREMAEFIDSRSIDWTSPSEEFLAFSVRF